MTAEDQVTVRFFAGARAAAGVDQVMVEPGPLEQVIESIHTAFPALAAVTPMCSFLVDSLSTRVIGGGADVAGGSTVDVLPPFAGG
ncbi:MAG: MoaD/ThiS family protein [Dermatophilaceae bacterium]